MSFLYVVGFNDLTKVGVTNDLKSQMDRISPNVIYQVFFSQNYLSLEENLESFLSKYEKLPDSKWYAMNYIDRKYLYERIVRQDGVILLKEQLLEILGNKFEDIIASTKFDDKIERAKLEGKTMAYEHSKVIFLWSVLPIILLSYFSLSWIVGLFN